MHYFKPMVENPVSCLLSCNTNESTKPLHLVLARISEVSALLARATPWYTNDLVSQRKGKENHHLFTRHGKLVHFLIPGASSSGERGRFICCVRVCSIRVDGTDR